MSLATGRLSPKANYVQYGYGQVEPNHLSARRTGQIYAQLPAKSDIDLLENGQFVKYDYANKEVNFTGAGEWMLVFNEVKVYLDYQTDADFAMKKSAYEARVYNAAGNSAYQHYGHTDNGDNMVEIAMAAGGRTAQYGMMKTGTTMVPRVLKTNIGDIFTTNCIKLATDQTTGEITETLAEGNKLVVDTDGYLKINNSASTGMIWQVARVYNMPDLQPGVKIIRIQ